MSKKKRKIMDEVFNDALLLFDSHKTFIMRLVQKELKQVEINMNFALETPL